MCKGGLFSDIVGEVGGVAAGIGEENAKLVVSGAPAARTVNDELCSFAIELSENPFSVDVAMVGVDTSEVVRDTDAKKVAFEEAFLVEVAEFDLWWLIIVGDSEGSKTSHRGRKPAVLDAGGGSDNLGTRYRDNQ